MEAAAERAAAQSAAIIEDAMAQAEDLRRKAAQETHSQVRPFLAFLLGLCQPEMRHIMRLEYGHELTLCLTSWRIATASWHYTCSQSCGLPWPV